MAKYIAYEHRIIVEPNFFLVSDNRKARKCQDLIDDIKRHVDDVDVIYHEVLEEATCSLCGGMWETEDGEPQCCTKAQQEYADAMLAAREEKGDE